MFFRKKQPVICAVCGQPIAPKERRTLVINRVTKAQRHTHITCRQREPTADA